MFDTAPRIIIVQVYSLGVRFGFIISISTSYRYIPVFIIQHVHVGDDPACVQFFLGLMAMPMSFYLS